MKDLDNKTSLEKEDLRYFKNLLLGAHEKIKSLELRQQIELTNSISTSSSVNGATLDYPKIIHTLEQEISSQNKIIENSGDLSGILLFGTAKKSNPYYSFFLKS